MVTNVTESKHITYHINELISDELEQVGDLGGAAIVLAVGPHETHYVQQSSQIRVCLVKVYRVQLIQSLL